MVVWKYWSPAKAGVFTPTGQACMVFAEVAHNGVRYFKAVLDGECYDFSAPAEKFSLN